MVDRLKKISQRRRKKMALGGLVQAINYQLKTINQRQAVALRACA
jgi:hypothetical protein